MFKQLLAALSRRTNICCRFKIDLPTINVAQGFDLADFGTVVRPGRRFFLFHDIGQKQLPIFGTDLKL